MSSPSCLIGPSCLAGSRDAQGRHRPHAGLERPCPTLSSARSSPRSTLSAVAAAAGCTLPPGADPDFVVAGLAPLASARADELALVEDDDELDDLRATRAGACLVRPCHRESVPRGTVALVTETPRLVLRRIAALVDPATLRPAAWPGGDAIRPGAIVAADARLEPGVAIAPGAIVGPGAEIGAATSIGAGALIEADVRVGRGCAIGPQVTLARALVGDRVVVHAGARIGACEPGGPGLGRAIVQDAVEIGANAVVACGGLRDTVVGEGAIVEPTAVVSSDAIVPRFARVRAPSR